MTAYPQIRRYPAPLVGRLSVSGPYFVTADGALVPRKSLTAFTLPKRYATGRRDDGRRYLDWAASKGANEVRVFTRTNWTGPPGAGVESGWAYDEDACAAVLTDAADRGLRVELVAHTYPTSVDEGEAHLRRVDALCLAHENALLEVWNEPQENAGKDPETLLRDILARYTPQTPGWASGWYTPTPYPAGESVNYHSPRDNEWPRKFKDAYEFFTGDGPTQKFDPKFLGPVMLDEPPRVEETANADDWRAYGAGAAFFAAGATMHGLGLQRCEIPTDPAVLACIEAFIAGFNDVPVQRYEHYERGDPPTPSDGGSRRYFRWNAAGEKYEICVRPYGFRRV